MAGISRHISMRSKFPIVILIAGLAAVAAADSISGHWAILPMSEGPALIRQCSRSGPAAVTGFWSPSASQVTAIEHLLPGLLSKSRHKIGLSNSYRQYIGIVVHGKKLVYLNSVDGSVLSESSEHEDWRTKGIIICDGGDAFWGVEFDPADHKFQDLQFNGGKPG